MIRKHQTGFTLIEMAIVLAILGIVLAGLFAGTSALRETSKFKEDQQKLQDIKAALLSYVTVNHYLPCPDTTGDGLENPNDLSQAQCDATSGNLPHLSLGTHSVNAYGLPFSYYINTAANDANSVTDPATSASYFGRMDCDSNTVNASSAPCFNTDTPPTTTSSGTGNFDISNDSVNIAVSQPLVVVSHGQNGCNNVTGREQDNCTNNATTYYQAPQNREGANAFDDVLIWLSSLEIKRTHLSSFTMNVNEPPATPPLPLPPGLEPAPDYESVDFNTDQTLEGDYDGTNLDITTNNSSDDKVLIKGDINSALVLGNGTDTLYLVKDDDGNGGDLNAPLTGSQQYKTIYIEGDVNADIILDGNQGNIVEIGGNVNATVQLNGNGENRLIVHGNINGAGTIDMQANNDNTAYVGSNVLGPILVDEVVFLGKTSTQLSTDEYNRIDANSINCRDPNDDSSFIAC